MRLVVRAIACLFASKPAETLIERRRAKAGQRLDQGVAQRGVRRRGQMTGYFYRQLSTRAALRPAPPRRRTRFERAGIEALRPGRRLGASPGARQRRIDPDRILDPRWRRRGGAAAHGGQSWQHPRDRESVALQSLGKQRPIATRARSAPGGKPPRRPIGIALLSGQRLEIVRQKLVDCRSANDQILEKSVH